MGLMNGNKQELLSMNYLKMVIFLNAPVQLDPKSTSVSITSALLSSLRIYKFRILQNQYPLMKKEPEVGLLKIRDGGLINKSFVNF